jgi:RNA polymerase sigma factor (sigma-70 family)
MAGDSSNGGGGAPFPQTRRSAVLGLAGDDAAERARSFEVLVRAYYKPVYKHVRLRFGRAPSEAEDLTQGFFAKAFEKAYLARYDPSQARFRTFLKTCLDRFVMDAARDERRQKRGGGAVMVSLDFEGVEREMDLLAAAAEGTDAFDAEWARSMLGSAVDTLEQACREQGKPKYWEVFRRFALGDEGDRPTYAQLARELDLSVSDVTNYLAWARRALRQNVLDSLRAITTTEEEFRSEARALLGVEP